MMDLLSIGFLICMLTGLACFRLFIKSLEWFEQSNGKGGRIMFMILFMISVAMFVYLTYVLLKPEKF